MKISSVQNIFKLAGGSIHVASLLNVHQCTVLSWTRVGIPIKHWKKLIATYDLAATDLFNVSEKARANEE